MLDEIQDNFAGLPEDKDSANEDEETPVFEPTVPISQPRRSNELSIIQPEEFSAEVQ